MSLPLLRLRMTPSEAKERLILSLIAAGGANLGGLLGDHAPTAFGWFKIILSTVVVVAVTWRSFITNPAATTTDPPTLPAPEADVVPTSPAGPKTAPSLVTPARPPFDPAQPVISGFTTFATTKTTSASPMEDKTADVSSIRPNTKIGASSLADGAK